MTEVAIDAKAIDIQGRPITLKKITVGQMALVMRESRRMQRDDVTGKEAMAALERVDTIVASLIVFDEDKEYVDELMAAGTLDITEMVQHVMAIYTEGSAEEKPKVRRGRPPKRS